MENILRMFEGKIQYPESNSCGETDNLLNIQDKGGDSMYKHQN